MGSRFRTLNMTVGRILCTLVLLCAVTDAVQADDALTVRFTPTDAGGSYGTKYVQAVWLTTTSGQRICTLGTGSGKVALWADTRYSSVDTWYNNNPTYRSADRTDRTGATQNGYREYVITWDWRKYNTPDPDGTVVPDGNYKLEFECSNGNGSAALHRLTVPVTKGRSPWVLTPANGDFLNVRVEYTPSGLSVSNTGASNITSVSARLNGEITDTGGENPVVFIYWGTADGGTTPANWEHSVNLGTLGKGVFFSDVFGLTSGTTYYYRCRAINSTKDVWTAAANPFKAVNAHMIFEPGDTWKYFKGYSTPANWNGLGFVDSSWLSGPTGIGYGDNDDATVLSDMANNYTTVYMRYTFNVDLPGDVTGLEFTVDYDDGFVAFINGQEVARRGLPSGQNKDTSASSHEASAGSGGNPPETIDLSAYRSALTTGPNVFAIEVHNADIDSSDLSMIPSLVMFGGMRPPQSDIHLSTPLLNFGRLDADQSKERTFTINNIGLLPLQVNSLTLTGLSPEAFTIVSPVALPLTIPPTGSQAVTVRCTPTKAGELRYTYLAVGSDDPDTPVTSLELIALNGSGPLYALRQIGGIGGPARSVAPYGSKILLGRGATLAVLDVSVPAHPVAEKQIRLAGRIEAIAVREDTAYVAAGAAGLIVVDLKTIPSVVDPIRFDTPGHATDVDCRDNYLCVADGIGGMRLYDITEANRPALVGTCKTSGAAKAVRIANNTAYLLDDKALSLIPLTTLPLTVQSVFDEVELGQTLELTTDTAYLADTLGGFFVVDISAGTPALKGHTQPQAGVVYGISVINSYAYLAATGGVEVIDISNAANPSSIYVLPTSGQPSDVIAGSGILCVADGTDGLRLLSLSNPAAPTEAGVYLSQAMPTALAGTGSEAIYIAQGMAGLTGQDLSNALTPAQISLLQTLSNARDVAISGPYACIAGGPAGMQIVDISNPTAPNILGTFPTDGFCTSVACSDSLAAAADGTSLYAVDISNPSSPTELNRWNSNGWFFDAAIDGATIFAAVGGMGIQVFTPAANDPIGTYPTEGSVYAIALNGNTVYAACGDSGLLMLDISEPAAPGLLGTYDATGTAFDVAVIGTRVCIAEAGFGVTVVDVADPARPVLYARSVLPQNALGILAADSRVFAADQRGGLAVLTASIHPTNPPADIAGTPVVDTADFAEMAENWLNMETELSVLPANLYYFDTTVNLLDLSVLVRHWMAAHNPLLQPLAYWPCDAASGAAVLDSSGNAYHGALLNADGSAWVSGKIEHALQLDGIDDYVRIAGYAGPEGKSARTISTWIKSSGNGANMVIASWGTLLPGQQFLFGVFSDGTLGVYSSGPYIKTTQSVLDNQWHHLAAVMPDDGTPSLGEVRLYIDGQLQTSTVLSSNQALNTVPANDLLIGAMATGPTQTAALFKGLIDEVYLFALSLSNEQIFELSR